jgi:hypothetical protein
MNMTPGWTRIGQEYYHIRPVNAPKSRCKHKNPKTKFETWVKGSRALTAAVKIQLHKSDWAVNPVIEGIFFAEGADPGEVGG